MAASRSKKGLRQPQSVPTSFVSPLEMAEGLPPKSVVHSSDHHEGWFTSAEWRALSGKSYAEFTRILLRVKEEGRLECKLSVRLNIANNKNSVPVYRILREPKK